MVNKYILFALFLTFTLPKRAHSQNSSTVKGQVFGVSGKPLEAITVLILKFPDSALVKTAVTDKSGAFDADLANPGKYLIALSVMGEKTFYDTVTIIPSSAKVIRLRDIILKPTIKGLKEVVIWEKTPFIERKAGKTVLNISGSNILIGNNAYEILNRAPGIQIDKNDNFIMKGKTGILIMIDGKLTNLPPSDFADLLRNTSHDAIERIDLITNPSANFDASGAGIIDIRLKKGKNLGTNGSFNAGLGYGDFRKVNSGINLNHRTARINLFGSYSVNSNKRPESVLLNRNVQTSNRNTSFSVSNLDDKTRNAQNYYAGIDYFIDSRHTLGFLFNGLAVGLLSDEENLTQIRNNSVLDSNILMYSNEKRSVMNSAYNFNYKGLLGEKRQELTVDLDYFTYSRDSKELLENQFLTPENTSYRNSLNFQNNSPADITISSGRITYLMPLSKQSSLDAGLKTSFVRSENTRLFENFLQNTWVTDPGRSDRFIFSEHITAAYLTYKNALGKKTELDAGLRAEETRTRSNSSGSNHDINRNYLDLFPSVHLSHQLSKLNKLNLSYSRRINRPLYEDLNPFLYFLDQYNFREGNPYLKPEYTSSFELGHIYKEKFSTTLNYTHVKDIFLSFHKQDDISGVIVASKKNLNSQTSFGVEFNTELPVTSWWDASYTLQGNYMHFTYFSEGNTLDKRSPYYIFDAINTFNFKKDLIAEIAFNYESATNYGLFDFKPFYGLDLSMSKSVMKNKASLRLSVTDIFNSKASRYSTMYQNLNLNANEKQETRVARITFNYRFGKTSVKGARKRSTGAEEESKRIKS